MRFHSPIDIRADFLDVQFVVFAGQKPVRVGHVKYVHVHVHFYGRFLPQLVRKGSFDEFQFL